MTTITDKKQYPGEQYLNELITNIEFAARAPVEVVRAMAAELQKRREADSAKPVSQTYNLPQTEFEQVVDLYEMQFDDGRTCAFHTDAQKAAQWLRACDGNRVQEYVKLERLQNALSGNSPVTPDSWISCSERMPNDGQHVIILCDGAFVLYAQYRDGEFFDIVRNGDEFFETQSRNVTDWMPLPEPPQEVNRG
ncbi:DUF551 domain-containing protein [Escherichia coli]|uniref:DUF551 domain-containing protein n=1 Tax=Escherichia coli TaxID=562 RepID=A0A789M8F6_ECOLX|nr:DUF551 domain-containing protein [Escherichia albertii]EGB5685876.1 DUF551 domain-containing protein [Escherichia coli]EHI0369052.1 DUF551 domain-containing protein [Escherichia coli]EHK7663457.1 DUF551 domain-containing protein [Escherichia coli]EHW5677872.1 DUF551 domain-containing protein [Escherichia albertii]EHX1390568.1 DUF551 domain-containing protein [Escherichia coli]